MLLKVSTARNRMVLLIASSDHISGLPGATLTITASKDGGAFAAITPTVTDRGSGWYELALTTTHTNTVGDLAIHITATSADPLDVLDQVVTDLPGASVTSIATGGITTGSFAAAAIDATVLATDSIGSAQLAATAVAEVVTGVLTTVITESYPANHAAPTLAQSLCLLIATVSQFGIAGTTLTTKHLDGTTNGPTYTLDDATNPTSRVRSG